MKFQNPLTKNYDCHCGSKSATICRLRHWMGRQQGSGRVAFLVGMTFLAFASGAPNRLNGCKSIEHETEQRHEYMERVREYNSMTPVPITEEPDETY